MSGPQFTASCGAPPHLPAGLPDKDPSPRAPPPRRRPLTPESCTPHPLTSVCRFMCSRRVNFFPQISQG